MKEKKAKIVSRKVLLMSMSNGELRNKFSLAIKESHRQMKYASNIYAEMERRHLYELNLRAIGRIT